ncbi:conserved hypothetical protein [uncultured Desulfobacterium sp.]|uniref:ABC transporter domain-containing protein n=1 Tax=uncultured Desulfobacterium sp. TaxID=201089 RepID=A0A445MVH8_9BACT|nr:conserved hypothetical protein [uncultured Desulfobacterium sp.]
MISLENVTKKYGMTTAVDDVSYNVDRGECFALLGPNGAGKTTIVRMILGFSHPTRGRISIGGIAAGKPASRKKIGYLAESHRIPPYLSGRQYLMRHASFCGLGGASAKRAVGDIIELVGMAGNENRKASAYSKGMVQRIGLGAALLGGPELLVLDEPVSGLDPLGMRDVRVILEEFRNNGTTIVLNSHLLSEVERICDTAAIMNKGRILMKNSISKIVRANETLEDVFIRLVEVKSARR